VLGGLPGGKGVFFIPPEMMQAMYVMSFSLHLHQFTEFEI